MIRWLTIEKFSAESGYTPDAVRSKIKRPRLRGLRWLRAIFWSAQPLLPAFPAEVLLRRGISSKLLPWLRGWLRLKDE